MVIPTADDFGELDNRVGIDDVETPEKTKAKPTKGTKRDWLKVWETAPAQMLNAQGQAKYSKMSLEQVWKELGQPQSSGAVYMTEYHSRKEERRGIATNRWLYALVLYCKYQKEEQIKKTERGYTEREEMQGAVRRNRQGIAFARVLSGTEESKRKKRILVTQEFGRGINQ